MIAEFDPGDGGGIRQKQRTLAEYTGAAADQVATDFLAEILAELQTLPHHRTTASVPVSFFVLTHTGRLHDLGTVTFRLEWFTSDSADFYHRCMRSLPAKDWREGVEA